MTVAAVQGYGGSDGYQSAYVITLDNIYGAGSLGLRFHDQGTPVTDANSAPLTGPGVE